MVNESNSYLVTAYTGAPGPAAYSTPDSGQLGTTTTYDGLERVKSVTDPLGNATTTSLTVVCNPAGTGDTACYEQAAVTDPQSHQHGPLHGALRRPTHAQRDPRNS